MWLRHCLSLTLRCLSSLRQRVPCVPTAACVATSEAVPLRCVPTALPRTRSLPSSSKTGPFPRTPAGAQAAAQGAGPKAAAAWARRAARLLGDGQVNRRTQRSFLTLPNHAHLCPIIFGWAVESSHAAPLPLLWCRLHFTAFCRTTACISLPFVVAPRLQTVAVGHPLLEARVRGCDGLAVAALQGARAGVWHCLFLVCSPCAFVRLRQPSLPSVSHCLHAAETLLFLRRVCFHFIQCSTAFMTFTRCRAAG